MAEPPLWYWMFFIWKAVLHLGASKPRHGGSKRRGRRWHSCTEPTQNSPCDPLESIHLPITSLSEALKGSRRFCLWLPMPAVYRLTPFFWCTSVVFTLIFFCNNKVAFSKKKKKKRNRTWTGTECPPHESGISHTNQAEFRIHPLDLELRCELVTAGQNVFFCLCHVVFLFVYPKLGGFGYFSYFKNVLKWKKIFPCWKPTCSFMDPPTASFGILSLAVWFVSHCLAASLKLLGMCGYM